MVILGDIGGTKSQFLLIEKQALFDNVLTYENDQFDSFDTLLKALSSEYQATPITGCYLAIAGPVINQRCEMTNLNWIIESELLKKTFPKADIQLINDLTATALAMPYMGKEDLHFLQGEQINTAENVAVMSVGTGMGQAILLWCNDQHRYRAIAGEGGHCGFAPHTKTEIQLLQYFWEQSKSPVSLENIASGKGLIRLLKFFAHKNPLSEEARLLSGLHSPSFNAEILRLAELQPNSIYRKAVDLLCDLIANELGNITLRCLCHGGAIVAGGMAARLLPFVESKHFVSRFADKEAFSALLNTIPVAFCTNTKAPIMGLYQYFVIQSTVIQSTVIQRAAIQNDA